MELTNEEKEMLRALRGRGFAVIVWTPEELGDVPPEDIEDVSISYVAEYFLNSAEGAEQ
jgi:hypothetical protein